MNYSYWEYKEWFAHNDFVIVGSGIVGLNCALQLKTRFPKSGVLILEKGLLPQGASTKNAGFACFGSVSELLSDLKTHSEEEVFHLVKKRWDGLQLLRRTLGDSNINYQHYYGYELFQQEASFEQCTSQIPNINQLLRPLFNEDVFRTVPNTFSFQKIIPRYIVNQFEGQIHTGKMMAALLRKAQGLGIKILNSVEATSYSEQQSGVVIQTSQGALKANYVLFATNGFSRQLFQENVQPARAQVFITKPLKKLHIKGTFHLDEGYYYFRNIDHRILLGGGRNLDFKTEETSVFGQTILVQEKLEQLLKEIILPDTHFKIDHRWSGIMGVGSQKKAIVKPLSNHAFCGIRLGGMGVAIGAAIGKELADLIN